MEGKGGCLLHLQAGVAIKPPLHVPSYRYQ